MIKAKRKEYEKWIREGYASVNGKPDEVVPENKRDDMMKRLGEMVPDLSNLINGISSTATDSSEVEDQNFAIGIDLGIGVDDGEINELLEDMFKRMNIRSNIKFYIGSGYTLARDIDNAVNGKGNIKPENVIIITNRENQTLFNQIENLQYKATIANVEIDKGQRSPETIVSAMLGILSFTLLRHMLRKEGLDNMDKHKGILRQYYNNIYNILDHDYLVEMEGLDILERKIYYQEINAASDLRSSNFVIRLIPLAKELISGVREEKDNIRSLLQHA